MKCIFKFVIVALGIFSSPANASYLDSVKDSQGLNVKTLMDDCVRTQWLADKDECEISQDTTDVTKMVAENEVYFGFGKYQLKKEEVAKLDRIISVIKDRRVTNIKIQGFTDPVGSAKYNLKLSQKRAIAVYDYLRASLDLAEVNVDIAGFGAQNIKKECPGLKGQALINCLEPNRRTEIKAQIQ